MMQILCHEVSSALAVRFGLKDLYDAWSNYKSNKDIVLQFRKAIANLIGFIFGIVFDKKEKGDNAFAFPKNKISKKNIQNVPYHCGEEPLKTITENGICFELFEGTNTPDSNNEK